MKGASEKYRRRILLENNTETSSVSSNGAENVGE